MKLLIMGASGAGSTTLGKALSERLHIPYFDTDQYFWLPSEPPFTVRRLPEERNALLQADLDAAGHGIVGGSLINWSKYWASAFDYIVFLYLPNHIRMERLQQREFERYGTVILNDPERKKQHAAFLEWANGYDDNTAHGRTLAAQEKWLQQVSCPVIEIRGNYALSEKITMVLQTITAGN